MSPLSYALLGLGVCPNKKALGLITALRTGTYLHGPSAAEAAHAPAKPIDSVHAEALDDLYERVGA